jgi:hypothetical protein
MEPTEKEWKELEDFAAESAAVMGTRWQPELVSAAFTRPPLLIIHGPIEDPKRPGYQQRPWRVGPMTMRLWIELDACRSPFLAAQDVPMAEFPQRLATALSIFTGEAISAADVMREMRGDKAVAVAQEIAERCTEIFRLFVEMELPDTNGTPAKPHHEDGFGSWLPLLAAIIEKLRLKPEEAMEMPVAQAVAILQAMKKNEGYRVKGANYRSRELEASAEKGGQK